MKIAFIAFVLWLNVLVPVAGAQVVKPLPSIEVTDPKDLANVQALNNTLSVLSQKVTACVDAGGKPEMCQCNFPKRIDEPEERLRDFDEATPRLERSVGVLSIRQSGRTQYQRNTHPFQSSSPA
jgi:hypothetical protein